MSSIERTAYPRLPRVITLKDLQQSFTPTESPRVSRRPVGLSQTVAA